jgi:phosphatidylglycerol:prolipoprotein diacylglycerol transferase
VNLFVLPFPALDPVALQLGPFQIRWYALAYIVGIFFAWWYAKRIAANDRLWSPLASPVKPAAIDDLVLWATLGVVVGGRAGYVLFYDLPVYLDDPLSIFRVWQGGMSFHGGFAGVILATALFARSRGIPVWTLIDVVAPGVPIGLFFGRIANFINGELWGNVTSVPWAMVFPNAGPLPRHPSQIYEAALEGVILFLLIRIFTHGRHKLPQRGFVSGVFCAGYGASRVIVEFFRQPDVQLGYLLGPVTMGMLLSLPMVLFGLGLILWSRRNRPQPA